MSASISKESYLLVQGGCSLSLSLHPSTPPSLTPATCKPQRYLGLAWADGVYCSWVSSSSSPWVRPPASALGGDWQIKTPKPPGQYHLTGFLAQKMGVGHISPTVSTNADLASSRLFLIRYSQLWATRLKWGYSSLLYGHTSETLRVPFLTPQ